MKRHAIQPDGVFRPAAPFSPVIVSGDHVYTAGQVSFDANGEIVGDDIATQTTQTLVNVAACLAAAGCTLADVVKVNVFLADLGDFAAFNDVYRATFEEPFPVRTTVQVGLPPRLLIEIEAVARVPAAS